MPRFESQRQVWNRRQWTNSAQLGQLNPGAVPVIRPGARATSAH